MSQENTTQNRNTTYNWTDNPMIENESLCLPSIVNDNLMYLKEKQEEQDSTIDDVEGELLQTQIDIANLENTKQDTLVSGENIKTINGQNILGEGNIVTSISEIYGSELIDVENVNNVFTIKSKGYKYEQGTASDTWVIEHNLGKEPVIVVIDSSGEVQVPNNIVYNSINQVTITFKAPFKGRATLT